MAFVTYRNVSNVSEVDFNSYVNSSNFYYQIVFDSAVCPSSTTNTYIVAQLSSDGGVTYQTSGYINSLIPSITNGIIVGFVHDGSLSLSYTSDGQSSFFNLWSGAGIVTGNGTYNAYASSITSMSSQVSGGMYNSSIVVDSIRLKSSDGNNISGNFYLYAY